MYGPGSIPGITKGRETDSLGFIGIERVLACLVSCHCGFSTEVTVFSLSPADSDAHSTTSSVSPAQSPCYSNQSDEGSDTEMASGSSRTPEFSFLDLTYWKR